MAWDFPGCPVVLTTPNHFHCCGPGSNPRSGTKVLEAVWHDQKKNKKKNLGNSGCFNLDLCFSLAVVNVLDQGILIILCTSIF